MMNRIICMGNRFELSDSAGPLVYSQLAERELPDGVEVVNGGLTDLNLLGLVEDSGRVVFVDTINEIGKPGEVLLIDDVSSLLDRSDRADKDASLGCLLTMIDEVVEGESPEILVVGLEPPHTDTALWRAVEMSIVEADREAKPPRQTRLVENDRIA